jgi:rubrerythrin
MLDTDEKRFCPTCKAKTMEPAEGILLTQEEYDRVEPGPLTFAGRMTPFQCPICKHVGYEPVV